MKIIDLIKISIVNLIRRKLRTALTVLGVVIGTVSVVIMLSIGFGIREISKQMYESEQSLTTILVTSRDMFGSSETKGEKKYLNDALIEELGNLEHVQHVSPLLRISLKLMQGKWEAYTQIMASDEQYFQKIKLESGEFPKATDSKMGLVYGNSFITSFNNPKNGKGYWTDGIVPDVDYHKSLFAVYETGIVSDSTGNEAPKAPQKKYIYPTAGVVAGTIEDYNTFSYGVYTNLDLLKHEIKKVYKGKAIPGQPTGKKGKPLKFLVYDELYVYADNLKNVETLRKTISDMGYEASSEVEWLNNVKKQTQMTQAMLGGIGLVSLVVAAIGIANTMMMSIYERTKEIGIMKVLGCDMNRIRDMFLFESAMIGLSGGIFGMLFSYGVSYIANHLQALKTMFNTDGAISIIPPWLAVISILFATLIGMLAGFLPSLRAMKLSPLAALRNE